MTDKSIAEFKKAAELIHQILIGKANAIAVCGTAADLMSTQGRVRCHAARGSARRPIKRSKYSLSSMGKRLASSAEGKPVNLILG